MALSATLAPRTRARAPRSMSSERTGTKLVTAFLLARLSLLVLSGRVSINLACMGQDHHRCTAACGLDVVLAGPSDADTGRRRILVIGQDDAPTAFPAAGIAVVTGNDTAAGLPGSRTTLPRAENLAARDGVGTPAVPVQAEDGHLLDVGRAGSASPMQATSTTLVVAGLIGLLGVAGAAAFIVHSITRPVRRAVRVLQVPADARLDRLRPTNRRQLPDLSRAPAAGADGPLDAVRETGAGARSPSIAADGSTATSGVLSSGAEQSRASARVVSAGIEQAGNAQSVAADAAGIAPDAAEARSVLPVIARVVRQAQLAFDATIEGARGGGADTGSALVATEGEEPPQAAARAADVMTITSAATAGPVGTTRYAAARGRPLGPTTALWHAVQRDRLVAPIAGVCETTVCGSLVRMSTEHGWPVAARDVCPACVALAH